MKKQKLILPVLAPAMILAGGLLANNTYATDGVPGVYLTDYNNQVICNYYVSSGENTNPCGATYGSWNAESNTLTLGAAADNSKVFINGVVAEKVTVKSSQDLTMAIYSESNLALNFGSNILTVPSLKDIEFGGEADSEAKTLTIDGGAITFVKPLTFRYADVVINNGSINASDDLMVNDLTINDGALNLDDASVLVGDKMEVKGGEVDINQDDSLGAIMLSGARYVQTGGVVNLTGEGSVIGAGIGGTNATATITGGELNIKNLSKGINLTGESTINFDGGKTVIEDSQMYALYIKDLTDPENGITFGEEIGIAEKGVVVNWLPADEDEEGISSTGIIGKKGTVTIEEGHTVVKEKGWAAGSVEPEDEDEESDVKVPDTGAINSKEGGALAIFTATTFIILSTIAAICVHKKHTSSHFKFDNK